MVIHLAIDTGTMRRHLFGGWAFLTFLAARAREGRLQIYVPWITHQEILTGIRDHVEDLTARKKLETGLAEIAKGQADESPLSALQLAAQQTRERVHVDTKNKYEAWIAAAQAEILPLTVQQADGAWDAYFAGKPPFRQPKSRTDLPDAFAFQALLELAARIGSVHFIVEDTPFRDACSRCSQVVCHKDIYGFCSSQGIAIDVSAETRLQKRQLPFEQLEMNARATLRGKLPGLTLRVPAAEVTVDRLKVESVRSVESLSLDRNSVIHIEQYEYLVAFNATAVLQCDISEQRTIVSELDSGETRAANYTAELHGHMLVRAAPDGPKEQLSSDIDSVEVTSVTLAANQDVVRVIRPPKFVTDRWFERYVEAITAPNRSGLVIVAGSKQVTRKRVAEHLLRLRQRRDPELGALYLISYPPEFSNTLFYVKSSWGPFGKNDLFEKAVKTSAKAIAMAVEEYEWLAPALGFVIHEDGFVVATMKRTTSVSAVVRELYSHGRDAALEHLRGVVAVTAADDERIKLRAATGGEWGDGSWWGILEHDEFVSRHRA
jgi:PIN domain